MVEFIILVLIGLYTGYIIFKKVKDMKSGNFCGSGCGSCQSQSKCHKK